MNVRHATGRHITVERRLTLGGTSEEHLDLLKTPSLRHQPIDNSVRRQPAALRKCAQQVHTGFHLKRAVVKQ
jgi:hypothetical protein